MTAKFITIEGIEGVGKSTASRYIQQLLTERKIDFITTREPGGTPVAEEIRELLLRQHQEPVSADTELLLMFACRAQNIAQVIRPALARQQWVLCDRFTDASFAYQGGGRGIDKTRIQALAEWVQGDLEPNRTILLDAPVAVGMQRLKSRNAMDRIESAGMEFFERVRESYLLQAQANPQRFVVIDAKQPLPEVEHDIKTVIDQLVAS